MAQVDYHPAPGFGELLPGNFIVPSNPIVPAGYVPRIGELLPGRFSVPHNPVVSELAGFSTLRPGYPRAAGVGDLSAGCGCIAGMCGQGCDPGWGLGGLGLGAFDPGLIGSALPWLLGAAALWMVLRPGGRKYREEMSKAREDYAEKVSSIRSGHRGYRRAGRGARSLVKRGLRAAEAAV